MFVTLLTSDENEPFVPPKVSPTVKGALGATSTDTVTVVFPPNATKTSDGERVSVVGPDPV